MKKTPFLTVLLILSQIVLAQKPELLTDLYKNEYRNFKDFVKYGQSVERDTTIDVKFYFIDIDIGVPEQYVGGTVTLRFEPKVPNLNSLVLNLNSSLTVDSIGAPCESFYQADNLIFIQLNGNYDPGDLIDLPISYHGVPVLAGGYKGMRYETHSDGDPIVVTLSTPYLAHYWYPCKDGPEDKADSVYMNITIPAESYNGVELMAVSNGVLENVIDNGETKTFQWRHRYPIVTYYIMAAVSNYVSFQDVFNGTGGESFPLEYFVFQEDIAISQTGVAELPEVIQFYSDVFGTYPFSNEKYGMTQIGFYGAIENQTNTIQNSLSADWFDVSVHELAHMWFGDMITLTNWHHCWLNEGFATYAEALWAEHQSGFQSYKNNMANNQFWSGGTLYLQNAADTFNTFQSIYYQKGAYTLHMLRGVLGDELFFDALMDYSTNPTFMYKNASTADLQQSFENSSGVDLDYFFDQWIYDEYWPFYFYNFEQNSNYDVNLMIYQAQEELFNRRPVFEMPVQIRFNFSSGVDTTITVWNDKQMQNFFFTFDEPINSVEIDPDKWILRKTFYDGGLPVSIDEKQIERSVQCFPNPFSNKVAIQCDDDETEYADITITDLLGRIILDVTLNKQPGEKFHYVWNACDNENKTVSSGIYLIELRTENKLYTSKIIKTD